ncbi:hypothetical protein N752_12215 [Desulforamulus aquiferis]|nr:transposase [Desulforamulus aquiferis]RYD04945.1 hypothetical protein N752_12215 [Desulforamulus aquiferis]
MPRVARILNDKQVYHIMLRGNNKESIFKNDADKERLIEVLKHKKELGEYFLYAYSIMDNHIHLVLKEGYDSLSRTMKRVGISYAQYFNKKYKRVGHVFQDRYKSENIDTESYLLAAIRYVHQNPVKAGIGKIDTYQWSSFKDFINNVDCLVEIDEVLGMFSEDKERGLSAFVAFNYQEQVEKFIDIEEDKELNGDNIQGYVDNYLKEKCISLKELKDGKIKI